MAAHTLYSMIAGQVEQLIASGDWREGERLPPERALCQRFDPDYEGELVARLGLATQLDKYPYQLSRGQQQRVAIARALLHKPQLVLADEPTGNLDEASSLEVMGLFSDLVKRAGSSLLMVTHSQAMAAFMDRRVNLHNGRLAEIE